LVAVCVFIFLDFVLFKKGGDVWVEKRKNKIKADEDYKGLITSTD